MVLCLTHSSDVYTIDIVQQSLKQAGMPSFRLNTDEFALNYRLKYSLQNSSQETCLKLNGQEINAAQISAVWYRKLWKLKVPEDLDPAYHDIFNKEYRTYLQIFFDQLSHVPWMNSMSSDHATSNDKLLQLITAKNAGLLVPETIFTNDPNSIHQLFEKCKGNLIVKLHGSLSKSMEGNTAFFPTTKLTAADMDRLDELAYCPMIFQEYIPKAYELRIVYVDGDIFAGKIPVESTAATDWRALQGGRIQWQHYELPLHVQEKLSAMMQRLGLTFGAIDMIKHTNGDYIFLEVNPQGEWGMIQKYLNYPIGETIAQKLITRIKNG
jgi:glutathione synthase/RimK-type ligase-like ATP-grasp enzyme